jgi:hypothetical protein
MAARSAISIRYYLWADDGPWRLPSRLHQDLIKWKVALPQYAGTKQKVLEMFARWIDRPHQCCRQLIYPAFGPHP